MSARSSAYLILLYSGILAVAVMVLSVMSLTAYSCGFDFRWSSLTYMLYLIYFRAGRCYGEVNWSILDGLTGDITLQPDMPTETYAVFRTLIFSVVYLVLSILLVVTCLLALIGIRRTGKSKHLIFWLYFAPFITVFVAMIVMDLLASGFYLYDYFASLGVNGLMRLMEVRNTDQMRPIFEQIAFSTRTLPPMIMFAATSKCILFLIINFFAVIVFTPTAWRVCAQNQAIRKIVKITREPTPPPTTIPSTVADVDLRVTRVEPNTNDVIDEPIKRPAPQPPYNPYLTAEKKVQETQF